MTGIIVFNKRNGVFYNVTNEQELATLYTDLGLDESYFEDLTDMEVFCNLMDEVKAEIVMSDGARRYGEGSVLYIINKKRRVK